jgi:methylmalonyl-CoA mutase
MSTLNFDEFDTSTIQQWQQLLTKELAGRTPESLNWLVTDDVQMEPYAASSSESFALDVAPNWEMLHGFKAASSKQWNEVAHEALMGGCNGLRMLNVPASAADLDEMLKGIFIEYIALHINCGKDVIMVATWLQQLCEERSLNSRELRGSFYTDFNALSKDDFDTIIRFTKEHFPLFRAFVVDATRVHEQGGSPIQEIAFALTEGHAFLVRCMEAGWNVDDASALIQFNFATGSSYFAEIAKYRAFRWAWKSIIEQYTPQYGCSTNTHISASTSRYYQTAKDVHNNLLRATTQAMSAVIGGVNGLIVEPYNSHGVEADRTALRLSRNIHQLLTEESYFESYRSAASGSHYIEQLTGKVVQAGWSTFQRWDAIRAKDGKDAFEIRWNLETAQIAESAQTALAEGKRIMVGVNKYVNKSDSSVVADGAKTFTASQEKA